MKPLQPVRAERNQLYRLTSGNVVPEKHIGQYINEQPYEFICPGCRKRSHLISGKDFSWVDGQTSQPLAFGYQVKSGLPVGADGEMFFCPDCDCSYTLHLGYAEPNNGRDVFPLHGIYQLRTADDLTCLRSYKSPRSPDSEGVGGHYQRWVGRISNIQVGSYRTLDLTLELIAIPADGKSKGSGELSFYGPTELSPLEKQITANMGDVLHSLLNSLTAQGQHLQWRYHLLLAGSQVRSRDSGAKMLYANSGFVSSEQYTTQWTAHFTSVFTYLLLSQRPTSPPPWYWVAVETQYARQVF